MTGTPPTALRTHVMETYARGLVLIAAVANVVSREPIERPYPEEFYCACCHRKLNDHKPSALLVCARVLDEERFWSFVLEKKWRSDERA